MRDVEFTTDHVDRAIDHVIDNGACDNGLLDDLHPDANVRLGIVRNRLLRLTGFRDLVAQARRRPGDPLEPVTAVQHGEIGVVDNAVRPHGYQFFVAGHAFPDDRGAVAPLSSRCWSAVSASVATVATTRAPATPTALHQFRPPTCPRSSVASPA